MSRRLLLAVLAVGLAPGSAGAEAVGTSGAQILTIEQGARGLGMGGAFISVADDSNALWWNPAGIAHAQYREATLSHTAYLDNIATEYFGYIHPVAQLHGVLGFSLTYLSIPGIDGTDASGNPTGSLKANGYVGSISYGLSVSSNLTVGVTGKYFSQTLGPNSGSDFAVDLGAQYWNDNYGVAVVAQNLGPSFSIGGVSDPLPRDLRAGAFYKPRSFFLISFDEEQPYNETAIAHLGGEWTVTQGIRLRAGFQQTPGIAGAGVTAGIGLAGVFGGNAKDGSESDAFKPFWERMSNQDFKSSLATGGYVVGLDYAFVSYGSSLNDVQRISLFARF